MLTYLKRPRDGDRLYGGGRRHPALGGASETHGQHPWSDSTHTNKISGFIFYNQDIQHVLVYS